MENIVVGIDVAKGRLDVAVRPSGDVFAVARNGVGLAARNCGLRAGAVGVH